MEEGLDGFAEVFDQMKPIHDLHGLRCPLTDALCIEGTPVSTDHGDRGMLCQPGRHALYRALRQQVQDPMILEIDQDGPIAVAAPPGPLVHADDVQGGDVGCRSRPHQSQQGVGAAAPSQPGHEPRTGCPAEGDAISEEELGEA
jgi:hypothetical protein